MKKKIITIATAGFLALGLIVAGTLAYLTATADPVTNTFTVGNIAIDLEEPSYDEPDGGTKLYPGATVDKDPTVTVKAGSEKSYVYMLMDNQFNAPQPNGIPDAITFNFHANWVPVQTDGTKTLYRYYQPVDASASAVDIVLTPLFTNLYVNSTLVTSDNIDLLDGKTIEIKAYAHQFDTVNEDTADAAARAFFGLPATP